MISSAAGILARRSPCANHGVNVGLFPIIWPVSQLASRLTGKYPILPYRRHKGAAGAISNITLQALLFSCDLAEDALLAVEIATRLRDAEIALELTKQGLLRGHTYLANLS